MILLFAYNVVVFIWCMLCSSPLDTTRSFFVSGFPLVYYSFEARLMWFIVAVFVVLFLKQALPFLISFCQICFSGKHIVTYFIFSALLKMGWFIYFRTACCYGGSCHFGFTACQVDQILGLERQISMFKISAVINRGKKERCSSSVLKQSLLKSGSLMVFLPSPLVAVLASPGRRLSSWFD